MTESAIRSRSAVLFTLIAQIAQARLTCKLRNNTEWFERHSSTLQAIERDILPSGSGIDSGTKIDLDRTNDDRLVLLTSFHHMNDGGFYDGWTEHTITVRPSLTFGITIAISGRDRNSIKEYLHDVYHSALTAVVTESYDPETERTTFTTEKG